MRIRQQQANVRPITTGHVEADMLGNVYLQLSDEGQTDDISAFGPHRTYKRKRFFEYEQSL